MFVAKVVAPPSRQAISAAPRPSVRNDLRTLIGARALLAQRGQTP